MLNLLLTFVFGLLIGSFLNVVVLRYQTGRSLAGRSGCFSCGKKLNWLELIPVFSFVWQKGRCRECQSRISWQYPLVESVTGFLFASIYWLWGGNLLLVVLYWVIISTLIFITVYDFRHKIIPDRAVFFLIGLSLLQPALLMTEPLSSGLLKALIGGLAFSFPLFFLWFISRGRWLGFGDVKLALGLGLLLGWRLSLSALISAFWLGALVSILLILWGKTQLWRHGKSYTMKSEIPFAPFLILGWGLAFFFSLDVLAFWQI